MKTARVSRPEVYEFTCPTCEEGIGNPVNGSFLWTPEELYDRTQVRCLCGEVLKIPASVVKKYAGGCLA